MSYNADKNGESKSPDIAAGSEVAEEIRELLALAGQFFQNDKGAEACQLLKRVLEMDPANQLVHRLLGRVNDRIRTLVETGQIDKAENLLVKVETSIGLDQAGGVLRREIDAQRNRDVRAELLLREARSRTDAGSLEEARESLRRILEVDPSHNEAAIV